jgi:hypothetical protein
MYGICMSALQKAGSLFRIRRSEKRKPEREACCEFRNPYDRRGPRCCPAQA